MKNAPNVVFHESTFLKEARLDQDYHGAVTVHSDLPGYSLKITGGELPEGLSMDDKGYITGKPTESGVFRFRVGVANADFPKHEQQESELEITVKGSAVRDEHTGNAKGSKREAAKNDTRTADEKMAGPPGTEVRDRRPAEEKLATDQHYQAQTTAGNVKYAKQPEPTEAEKVVLAQATRDAANPASKRQREALAAGASHGVTAEELKGAGAARAASMDAPGAGGGPTPDQIQKDVHGGKENEHKAEEHHNKPGVSGPFTAGKPAQV